MAMPRFSAANTYFLNYGLTRIAWRQLIVNATSGTYALKSFAQENTLDQSPLFPMVVVVGAAGSWSE
jgi:hypothetical protein